jgi:hypothetical protein
MKLLAISQMFFGLAVTLLSYFLANLKAHILPVPTPNGDHFIVNAPPPSFIAEFILLGFGMAILICGLIQWKAHVKGSIIQIILGLILAVIYLFLGVRAFTLISGERSGVYYLAYFSLALGIAVFAVGVLQIIYVIKNKVKST